MAKSYEVELISPELALQMLSGSRHNFRSLDAENVKRIANSFLVQGVQLDYCPIIIDSAGNVRNGQHRLHALVKANVSGEFLVVRDCDDQLEALDTGKKRSLFDALRNAGECYAKELAGAVSHFAAMVAPPDVAISARLKMHPSIVEGMRLLRDHPGLRDSVQSFAGDRPLMPRGALAATHYFLGRIDRELSDKLCSCLLSSEPPDWLSKEDPVLLLRKQLIERRPNRKQSIETRPLIALVLKVWNFWREGTSPGKLSWACSGPKQEKWPVAK